MVSQQLVLVVVDVVRDILWAQHQVVLVVVEMALEQEMVERELPTLEVVAVERLVLVEQPQVEMVGLVL
jgi:hypothetical protein